MHASETSHALEIRYEQALSFIPATDCIYQPAVLLEHQGRLTEAIDEAGCIRKREYGDFSASFRVVTTMTTWTFKGPFEDAGIGKP